MNFLTLLGKSRWFSALAALLIAFGAGYLMQVILADRTPLATVNERALAGSGEPLADQPVILPVAPAETLVALAPPLVLPDRVHMPEAGPPEVRDDAGYSPFGFACEPELTLKVLDAAIVEARLLAPCDPNQRVTIRHEALEFEVTTDSYGRMRTVLPALSDTVSVTAMMERQSIRAAASVSDAGSFSRVLLVWEGEQVFRMNAYELGARRGEAGHVRAGREKTAKRALRGTGGFMVSVGDGSGRSAEVYSFPTGHSPLRGVVELIVEADVTAKTCGRLAQATALQTGPLGGLTATDIRFTLPDCDRAGDVMEWTDLLQDMKLAGR